MPSTGGECGYLLSIGLHYMHHATPRLQSCTDSFSSVIRLQQRYGLLMTQTRQRQRVCSAKGDSLLARFEYLGSLCHAEPTTEPFGIDPTFVSSSSVFRQVAVQCLTALQHTALRHTASYCVAWHTTTLRGTALQHTARTTWPIMLWPI